MTPVELIASIGGTAVAVTGGPKLFRLVVAKFFHKQEKAVDATVEIAKQKEITERHKLDLDVKLTGTTQHQVLELQKWMREQLVKLNEINLEQAGVIGTQAAEIRHLNEEVAALKTERALLSKERAAFKSERDELDVRCREVVAQGRDLVLRLEAKDSEVTMLRTRNADITRRLDDEIARSAQLASENERLRARGGTEKAG